MPHVRIDDTNDYVSQQSALVTEDLMHVAVVSDILSSLYFTQF